MDNRTRFLNVLTFKPVDRLPVIEWIGWWDLTIDRWHGANPRALGVSPL